jgi:putative Holliday junction resolvase
MAYLIGIDFGRRKIGLAISDSMKKIAFPLETINRENNSYGFNRLKKIIGENEIEGFVVGIPYREDGTLGEEGSLVLEYTEHLNSYFNKKVVTWDERYTTVIAHKSLLHNGKKERKKKEKIDTVAAQIILQSYLDSQNTNISS